MDEFDVIVVGGGSAGCALARRLSENPDRRVLLLEAGANYRTLEEYPAEFLDLSYKGWSRHGAPDNWTFRQQIAAGVEATVARGRLIGGCSAVNGTYFIRATKEDFARWSSQGNSEWTYEKVLPSYKRLEDDQDFSNSLHGSGGPVPVRRDFETRSHPLTAAFFEAVTNLGIMEELDKNGSGPAGIGVIPRNVANGQRINTALSYLIPNADRRNLVVQGQSFVRRVLLQHQQVVGVEVEVDGQITAVHSSQVILSAGAIKSPHILMLSGIGAADELRTQGIDLVTNLPGVGKNFSDHVHFGIDFRPTSSFPLSRESGKVTHACLNFTADDSPYKSDIEVINRVGSKPGSGSDSSSTPTQGFGFKLTQPESRGEIRLISPDPHYQPEINCNCLHEETDIRRVRQGVRFIAELLRSGPVAAFVSSPVNLFDDDLVSDQSIDSWIRRHVAGGHTSRSCHMGPESDPTAVVDQFCRVYGVEGLRIADTSIMPEITSRGPSATAVMIGERAAELFEKTLVT